MTRLVYERSKVCMQAILIQSYYKWDICNYRKSKIGLKSYFKFFIKQIYFLEKII